ncbi:MAG TPA: bifunctional (p)ppGpp synthetase/guanosine-3',5'-bis(diphosphate) 3'-pyrophosphohydrolase [Spirochaetes bacterium]|nr:bifunctional (p)ppGpp synthetase/guanosine-3',5'-bis(diphosphate) 3'-pyrophosphohydrolase [Spirochaetota bacterium]
MEYQAVLDIKDFVDLSGFNKQDVSLIKKACAFASTAHESQKRLSGEPFIIHPLHVAGMLFEMGFDAEVIAAGLLHDTVEDTGITLENLKRQFGQEISNLVDGVTKISRIRSENIKQRQAENIRKMLFSMVNDIRIILIKLTDKLHNMRTLEYLEKGKAQRIAKETLDIYAPLAGRLGMARFKIELEDLSLKYMNPGFYNDLKSYVTQRKEVREKYIEKVKLILQKEFAKYNIKAKIMGRAKHFYSIYKKMKDKEKTFDEIFDLFAIRIIAGTVKECYEIMGVVHKLWIPFRGRFKDYVAVPKSNMYRSLHTTVIGPEGKTLEVQIRTHKMNMIAEEGISAHWAYKEGKKNLSGIEKELTWLRKLKMWKENMDNPTAFMEDLQKELLEDEIYVFTPKGDVIELPIDSTPIDFAYRIHTEIGNHCFGAMVNDRISPLRNSLHSCDVIEILTSKNATPGREWLDVIKTSHARHKIRAFFSKHETKEETHKQRDQTTKDTPRAEKKEDRSVKEKDYQDEFKLRVEGEKNVQMYLAQCCNPHPGDEITGYITRGKGITVHRANCKNLKAIKDYQKRKITVEWEEKTTKVYSVDIVSKDRSGLLMEITTAIANTNANIVELHMKASQDGLVKAAFRIQIKSSYQLKLFLKDIKAIPDVKSIDFR